MRRGHGDTKGFADTPFGADESEQWVTPPSTPGLPSSWHHVKEHKQSLFARTACLSPAGDIDRQSSFYSEVSSDGRTADRDREDKPLSFLPLQPAPPPPREDNYISSKDPIWEHLFVLAPKLTSFTHRHIQSVRHPVHAHRKWGVQVGPQDVDHQPKNPRGRDVPKQEEIRWGAAAAAQAEVAHRHEVRRHRRDILNSQSFQTVCRKWWVHALGDEQSNPAPVYTQLLTRQAYSYVEVQLNKELIAPDNLLQAVDAIHADYTVDCGGADGVSFPRYCQSLLEVCDTWTSTTEEEEYVALLLDLMNRVFERDPFFELDAELEALHRVVLTESEQREVVEAWDVERKARREELASRTAPLSIQLLALAGSRRTRSLVLQKVVADYKRKKSAQMAEERVKRQSVGTAASTHSKKGSPSPVRPHRKARESEEVDQRSVRGKRATIYVLSSHDDTSLSEGIDEIGSAQPRSGEIITINVYSPPGERRSSVATSTTERMEASEEGCRENTCDEEGEVSTRRTSSAYGSAFGTHTGSASPTGSRRSSWHRMKHLKQPAQQPQGRPRGRSGRGAAPMHLINKGCLRGAWRPSPNICAGAPCTRVSQPFDAAKAERRLPGVGFPDRMKRRRRRRKKSDTTFHPHPPEYGPDFPPAPRLPDAVRRSSDANSAPRFSLFGEIADLETTLPLLDGT